MLIINRRPNRGQTEIHNMTTNTQPRYSDAEHARILKWQDSWDRKMKLYNAKKSKLGPRNIGPSPNLAGWGK
jgi:hypothetical protein